jgi:hypothetical protein
MQEQPPFTPSQGTSQPGNYQFQEYAGTPYPPAGYAYPVAAPYPVLPVQRAKKPLLFPVTRSVPPHKQTGLIAAYSALLLALCAGSVFFLGLSGEATGGFVASANHLLDALEICVFLLLLLFILPAAAWLSGALFGAWRGFLVALITIGGTLGLWIAYAVLVQHLTITLNTANGPGPIFAFLAIFTAPLIGFFYNRRRYASWGKSFLCLLVGPAILVTITLAMTALLGSPQNSSSSTLAGFYVAIGCIWLLAIPLMTLPIAGIEGLLHAILSTRSGQRKPGP